MSETRQALLILGHPENYRQFLDHIGGLGFRAVVINKRVDGTYPGKHIEFVQCDPNETAQLLALAAELHARWKFGAVLTHNEFTQYASELVAQHLGLPCRDPEVVRSATNKCLMKQRFVEQGVPTAPEFTFLDLTLPLEQELERIEGLLAYPLIIKPPTGLFSVGVRKVQNRQELLAALPPIRRVAKVLRSSSTVPESASRLIVERYIHGSELNVDVMTVGGEVYPLMASHKLQDLFGPHFQENALFFADCDEPMPAELRELAKKVVRAFPLPDPPYHIEVRREFSTGKYYVVEFAPRLSGMGSCIFNMMKHAAGLDLFETLIQQRHGRLQAFPQVTYRNCVLQYDTLVHGSGKIKALAGLDDVLADPHLLHANVLKKVGDTIAPLEYNVEAVAVFYLKSRDREHALSQMKWLDETFRIEFEQ